MIIFGSNYGVMVTTLAPGLGLASNADLFEGKLLDALTFSSRI